MARKISSREKRFLAAAAGAVLLFAAGRWLAVPWVRSVTEAPEVIGERLAVMEAYQGVIAREGALGQEAGELEAALEKYAAYLLPASAPPLAAAELQNRIKAIADRSGLNIQSEKILPHQAGEFYLEIPVQIVATGKVEQVRDFILFLESAETYIGIRALQLRSLARRRSGRGNPGGTVSGEIQATITISGLIPAGGTMEGEG